MGKVKLGVPLENSINHFSHPHPLELTTQTIIPSSSSSSSPSCSACKLQLLSGSPFYACKTCNFSLHPHCFKLHPEITHPFHNHHVLTLLPETPYPFGLFSCDACGEQGDGFSYHCHACGLDLHVQCAVLPLSVTHHSHHHPLRIIFPSPHSQTQVFSCDICKSLGQGNLWKYRCHSCDFDAHLNCTKTVIASASRIAPQPNLGFRPHVQQQQFNRPLVQNLMTPNVNPMNLQGNNNGAGNNGARQNFELMRAYIENYSRLYGGGGAGTATQIGGGSGGGGGGGGLDFLQALNGGGGLNGDDDDYLRLLTGGGSGGGGGGGGGGLDFLQGLNGGGGLDHYLQLLNAGGSGGGFGGAGGLEYLQAFTGGGGGGGGGGGAAFLQALMGGGGGGGGSDLTNILGGDGGASMINTLAGLFGGLNF